MIKGLKLPEGSTREMLDTQIVKWLDDKASFVDETIVYKRFCIDGVYGKITRIQFSAVLGELCTSQKGKDPILEMQRGRSGKAKYRGYKKPIK